MRCVRHGAVDSPLRSHSIRQEELADVFSLHDDSVRSSVSEEPLDGAVGDGGEGDLRLDPFFLKWRERSAGDDLAASGVAVGEDKLHGRRVVSVAEGEV